MTMKLATKIRSMRSTLLTLGGLMAMDDDSFFDNVDVLEGSFAPMD
jgi:hypothetical protein